MDEPLVLAEVPPDMPITPALRGAITGEFTRLQRALTVDEVVKLAESIEGAEVGKLLDKFNGPTHFVVKVYLGDDLRHIMIFGSHEEAVKMAETVKAPEHVVLQSWKQ